MHGAALCVSAGCKIKCYECVSFPGYFFLQFENHSQFVYEDTVATLLFYISRDQTYYSNIIFTQWIRMYQILKQQKTT